MAERDESGKVGEIRQKEKIHEFGVSVAGIVTYLNKLLLVVDMRGNVGLPAGHADVLEQPIDVFIREFKEETNLPVDFIYEQYYLTTVYWITSATKTGVGIVISGLRLPNTPELPPEWNVNDPDGGIVKAKFFDADEVFSLITSGKGVRKPEYNLGQLTKWMLTEVNLETNSTVRKWVLDNRNNYDYGIFQETKDPLNYHYLVFRPLNFIFDRGVMLEPDLETLMKLENTQDSRLNST